MMSFFSFIYSIPRRIFATAKQFFTSPRPCEYMRQGNMKTRRARGEACCVSAPAAHVAPAQLRPNARVVKETVCACVSRRVLWKKHPVRPAAPNASHYHPGSCYPRRRTDGSSWCSSAWRFGGATGMQNSIAKFGGRFDWQLFAKFVSRVWIFVVIIWRCFQS